MRTVWTVDDFCTAVDLHRADTPWSRREMGVIEQRRCKCGAIVTSGTMCQACEAKDHAMHDYQMRWDVPRYCACGYSTTLPAAMGSHRRHCEEAK